LSINTDYVRTAQERYLASFEQGQKVVESTFSFAEKVVAAQKELTLAWLDAASSVAETK
jgi:hypothetical protein